MLLFVVVVVIIMSCSVLFVSCFFVLHTLLSQWGLFFKVRNLAFTEESQQKKSGSTQPSWSPHIDESTAEFYHDIFPCCHSCLVFCCVFAVVFCFFVFPVSIFMEMLELCNSGFVSYTLLLLLLLFLILFSLSSTFFVGVQ